MIDQFTKEYMYFILSDEGKVLQKFARWDVGDWCVYVLRDGSQNLELIAESPADFTKWDVAHVLDGCRIVWLPTLFDLIQIVEGAVCWWDLSTVYDGSMNLYEMVAGVDDTCGPAEISRDDDMMLAAARLAVKALGGTDGS